jgi:histidine triad (HIT) family protein
MEDTIFDRILRKEIPADVVYEDEDVLAFNDINPKAPTHVLVIPKLRMQSFVDIKNQDPVIVGRFMKAVSQIAQQLNLEQKGYRIVFNTGKDGGQEVPYIHAHILGGRPLTWPPG